MLRTTTQHICQTVLTDVSPMQRLATTVLGKARQTVEVIFRPRTNGCKTPWGNVVEPLKIVQPTVVSKAAAAGNYGYFSKFLRRQETFGALVKSVVGRESFRVLRAPSFGANSGSAFKAGLGRKISMFAFVAIGVAAGYEDDLMRRVSGFDQVPIDIQLLLLGQQQQEKLKRVATHFNDIIVKDEHREVTRCLSENDDEPEQERNYENNENIEQNADPSFVFISANCHAAMSLASEDSDIAVLDDLEDDDDDDEDEFAESFVKTSAITIDQDVLADDNNNNPESPSLSALLLTALSLIRDQGVELGTLRAAVLELKARLEQAVVARHEQPILEPLGLLEPIEPGASALPTAGDKPVGADVTNEPGGAGAKTRGAWDEPGDAGDGRVQSSSVVGALLTLVQGQTAELRALRHSATTQRDVITQLVSKQQQLPSWDGLRLSAEFNNSAYSKREACCGPGSGGDDEETCYAALCLEPIFHEE